MTFKTSLDNFAKISTVASAVLFISFLPLTIVFDKKYGIVLLCNGVLLLLAYLFIYIIRPVSYILTHDELIIHRLYKPVVLGRTNIKSVEPVDKKVLRSSIRTFGVGGIFGYFGKFYNFKMGRMTWYATRRDRAVLVKTNDNRNIILTPNDPDGLIAACKL